MSSQAGHMQSSGRTHLVINVAELPGPSRVVQKGSQVKPVVVRTVAFSMICWREGCHLVPVHGVLREKPFHLLSHLVGNGHTGFELERQERCKAKSPAFGET